MTDALEVTYQTWCDIHGMIQNINQVLRTVVYLYRKLLNIYILSGDSTIILFLWKKSGDHRLFIRYKLFHILATKQLWQTYSQEKRKTELRPGKVFWKAPHHIHKTVRAAHTQIKGRCPHHRTGSQPVRNVYPQKDEEHHHPCPRHSISAIHKTA